MRLISNWYKSNKIRYTHIWFEIETKLLCLQIKVINLKCLSMPKNIAMRRRSKKETPHTHSVWLGLAFTFKNINRFVFQTFAFCMLVWSLVHSALCSLSLSRFVFLFEFIDLHKHKCTRWKRKLCVDCSMWERRETIFTSANFIKYVSQCYRIVEISSSTPQIPFYSGRYCLFCVRALCVHVRCTSISIFC